MLVCGEMADGILLATISNVESRHSPSYSWRSPGFLRLQPFRRVTSERDYYCTLYHVLSVFCSREGIIDDVGARWLVEVIPPHPRKKKLVCPQTLAIGHHNNEGCAR